MPVKYISYHPNTVEGQALLNNIARTQRLLLYRDNDKVYQRLKRGLPWYETEPVETVGDPDAPNLLIRGECLSACAYLKDRGIKVDLVYIDPPFASGANYAKKVYLRQNAQTKLDAENGQAFEETMYGDIWQKEDYLNWMYENLTAIKSVMSNTASIYLHIDATVGHYVKILLDEIFGGYEFAEIIWICGLMGSGSFYPKAHETIYCYQPDGAVFNPPQRLGLSPRITNALSKDENGWFYTRGRESSGGSTYLKSYISNNPDLSKEEAISEANESRNQPAWSVWMGKPDLAKAFNDYGVGTYAYTEKENVSYTTQKPEALLERIIKAASKAGMLVADFFGGSGVTAKVASDLGRSFIHVDVGLNSIQTARDRLVEAGASFNVLEIKDGVSLFRNPAQTMDKLAKIIPGLQQNIPGLGKFWFGAIQDSKLGTIPVYVPNLLDHTQKVLDIPAVNRILNQELPNLKIEVKKAVVYYIDIDDRAELTRFIKEANPTLIEIALRDLKAFLDEITLEDNVDYEVTAENGVYRVTITRFTSDRLMQKIDDYNQKRRLTDKRHKPIQISATGLELIELVSLDSANPSGPWHSSSEIKIDKNGYISVNGAKTKDLWSGQIVADEKPLRLKVRNISGDETVITM